MTVDMDLVRADPALKLTPGLMNAVQTGDIDLETYVSLLLQDLTGASNPLKHALSLVEQGNVAAARSMISRYPMNEKEKEEFDARCLAARKATTDWDFELDKLLSTLGDDLEPSILNNCLALQHAWREAIAAEHYHLAHRDLAVVQGLLTDRNDARVLKTGKSKKPDPQKPTTALDQAVQVWERMASGFSNPTRGMLRPDQNLASPPSYVSVRHLLHKPRQPEEGWQQSAEEGLKLYPFLDTNDRMDLEQLYYEATGFCALERLKMCIMDQDFDTALLLYKDTTHLLGREPQLDLPEQFVYESYRYGIEVHAALSAFDRAKAFSSFEKLLSSEIRRLPRHLRKGKANRIRRYGRVLFFYYRIHQLSEAEEELIRFFEENNTSIERLIEDDIELNRFYNDARDEYNRAIYRKAEEELTASGLPVELAFEDTLEHLRGLTTFRIVSALKDIQERFAADLAEGMKPLMRVYDLLLVLFDIQEPEGLLFSRDRVFETIESIRSGVKPSQGEHFEIGPANYGKIGFGVLDTLIAFVDVTAKAVATTDLASKSYHVTCAIEELRKQRSHLQDMNPTMRHLWHMLGDHWISILVQMQRSISRQTSIEVSLQADRVLACQRSPLVVYVKNSGPGLAKDIEITLLSSDLSIKQGIQKRRFLASGDECSFSYSVTPLVVRDCFAILLLVRHLDPDGNQIITHENRVLIAQQVATRRFPDKSPYVWGQPLTEGSRAFVGREDVFEFLSTRFWGEERNKIIALQGERRMGKTSILNQLSDRKIFRDYRVVFFDFQGRYANIHSIGEFLFAFARRVKSQARFSDDLKVTKSQFYGAAPEYHEFFEKWLDCSEEELERHDTQVVILFDEFEKLLSRRFDDSVHFNMQLVDELLNFLRAIMLARERFNWVIAGSWSLVRKQKDYFSSVFGMALSYWISYLKREEAIRLIQEPVQDSLTYEQDAVERILRLTAGHPFFIQIICDELFHLAKKNNTHQIEMRHVNEVVANVMPQLTETSFRTTWASLSTPTSRKALATVAEAMQGPGEFVLTEHVLSYLRRKYYTLDEDLFYEALHPEDGELIQRELVETHASDPERIRVRGELLYQWLRKSKRLAMVLREER